MISANELRVGNFLLETKIDNNDIGFTVSRIDEDFLEILMGSRNYEALHPIEIIPEILEKCGFELLSTLPRGLKHWWSAKMQGYLVEHNDSYKWAGYETPFKYLHQLQNLYFALIGEELEINLQPFCP
jgi:hypothetical protein